MRYALWGLAVLLLAEVARFLNAEVQRRRALDPQAFPADPARAARLSPGSLENYDRDEAARGLGLLLRMDLALAGLIAATAHGLNGAGLLFWVALALGPAQLLFLVPALAIGLNARQPRAVGAILKGSLPPFVVSALCGSWLMLGPRPAAPPPVSVAPPVSMPPPRALMEALAGRSPAVPALAGDIGAAGLAGTKVRGTYFSLILPQGWSPEAMYHAAGGVRFFPEGDDRSSPQLFIEVAQFRVGDAAAAQSLVADLMTGFGGTSAPEGLLGELRGRTGRLITSAGQLHLLVAAARDTTVYSLHCFGRAERQKEAEQACELAARGFRPIN